MKFKIITVSIACLEKDSAGVESSLLNLQEGIYSFGTTQREATKKETAEILKNVPEEAFITE